MSLSFEQGDPKQPRGHALLYFTDASDPSKTLATYIVLLPVLADIKKYVPPFLAGQVEAMNASDFSAFAFPPAPEPVESTDWVRRIAQARDDDLLNGGKASLKDPAEALTKIGEIVAEYSRLYASVRPAAQSPGQTSAAEEQVDDVMYGLMNEADLLAELTSLIGRLRFAAEGGDTATATDSSAKIKAIGRRVPENRRVARLVEVATDPSPAGGELAQLFLDRAFALYREDYRRVKALEARIAELEGNPTEGGPGPVR